MKGYEVHERVVEEGMHCGDGIVAEEKIFMAMSVPFLQNNTYQKY